MQSSEIAGRIAKGEKDFSGMQLRTADFSSLSLKGCLFDNAVLDDSNFSHADLSGCSFKGASMERCNLTGALLRNSGFENANMQSAIFTGAIFENTSMRNANLSWAHLCRADLMSCDITDAALTFSCLVGTSVSEDQIKSLPPEVLTTIRFSEDATNVKGYDKAPYSKAKDANPYFFSPGHYDGHRKKEKKY